MAITDLEKPIKITVMSDVGFKSFQFMDLSPDTPILTYEAMKALIKAQITGKKCFKDEDGKEPDANLIIRVHYYDSAPAINLQQMDGKWKVVYSQSASYLFISNMEAYINQA